MSPGIKLSYLILVPLSFIVLGANIYFGSRSSQEKKPLAGFFNFSQKWSFNFSELVEKKDSNLEKIVNKNLEGQDGHFAIYIESLQGDNKRYGLNEDEIFPAASLYKLYLLAAAYEEIEKGGLKEDDVISTTKTHLNESLGGEEFGYEGFDEDISFEVSSILSRVATISDNYAAIMLAEKIGWEKVREQAKKMGSNQTIIKSPITTTAEDTANFFKKLYLGEVVSPQSSQKIADLLSKSKLNQRIPAKLPEGVKIAHKTGELSKVRHDGGIVYLDGYPYVIVLMSKDLKGEDSGVMVLAQISKDVYEYFNSLNGR